MSKLLPIALLIAAVGIFFGYANPRWSGASGAASLAEKSVTELRADEAEYTDALEKTREIERVRDGLLERYNALSESDRERLKKLLPDHIDTVRLLIDVSKRAEENNLTLRDVSFESDTSSKGAKSKEASGATPAAQSIGPVEEKYATLEVGFSVRGSYENLTRFLGDLEHSLRLVDVTSLSFSSKTGGEYEYKIRIKTYRLGAGA